MERQTRLYGSASTENVAEELPRHLTADEIATLSASDYAIYNAAMREKKRRKALIKREDEKDDPGKGSSWNVHRT